MLGEDLHVTSPPGRQARHLDINFPYTIQSIS